jgi:hypothetical protein
MMHTIVEGDSIPSLAFAAGLFPDTIWNHPQNAQLKEQRQDMNVLFPGDLVFVPDKQRRVEMADTDQLHKFRRKGVPCRLRLQLFNIETPRANEDFELSIDGRTQKGSADGAGVIEIWLPPDAKQGALKIGKDDAVIELKFGHMDPLAETAGLQKRLANVGYPMNDAPGEIRDSTREALLSFQRRFQLKESGEFDDPTKALLAKFHDRNDLFPPDPWLTRT